MLRPSTSPTKMKTVSYTHLDVYKRQDLDKAGSHYHAFLRAIQGLVAEFPRFQGGDQGRMVFQHAQDVYKRQSITCTPWSSLNS